MKMSRAKFLAILSIIGIGIALTVFVGLIYELGGPSGNRLKYLALLVSVGGLFGTSLALDGQSKIAVIDSMPLRVVLSALFGASGMLVISSWFPSIPAATGIFIGAVIGAILGFFGWDWAKYVDF